MIDLYAKVLHDGKTVDYLTHLALVEAEKRLGYKLTIVQGSYHAGVSASAGTHDGGGVIDLAPWDWQNKVRVLRDIGFAAWHRTPIPGVWGEHIHAVLIGNKKLAPSAARQVTSYYNHRDGLARNEYDDEYRPAKITVFNPVERARKRMKVIFCPLHGNDTTNAEIDHAFKLGAHVLTFSEGMFDVPYMRKAHSHWRIRTGTSPWKDKRGRRTAWDSPVATLKSHKSLAHGSFIAAKESTPLKIAPRRHIVWERIRVGYPYRTRSMEIINTHTHAALGDSSTDRWKQTEFHMEKLENLVKDHLAAHPHLHIVVTGDFNYAPSGPNRHWAPEQVFERLGFKWVYSELGWVAYDPDKFELESHKIHSRKEVGQDHTWIEVNLFLK